LNEDFRRENQDQLHLDCFHNGRGSVLPAVKEWHEDLRALCHKEHSIVPDILEFVDQHMLTESPANRATAQQVCEKLNTIVKTANKKLDSFARRYKRQIQTFNHPRDDVVSRLLEPELDSANWTPEVPETDEFENPQEGSSVQAPPVVSFRNDNHVNEHSSNQAPPTPMSHDPPLGQSAVPNRQKLRNGSLDNQSDVLMKKIFECCKGEVNLKEFKEMSAQDSNNILGKCKQKGINLATYIFREGSKTGDFNELAWLLCHEKKLEVQADFLGPEDIKKYEDWRKWKKWKKKDQLRKKPHSSNLM
jgi:hypothetical protein